MQVTPQESPSSHNLTSEVAGDPSQGTSHDLTIDVMDHSTRKVIHGPESGSEPLEFPMPVCGTEIKVQPTTVPQVARSTESGMGNVVIKGSSDPGRSPATVVARGHVPVQRTAERHVHFSTEAIMLTGDHSGSRATVSTVDQPPTAIGAESLNPSLRDGCVNPGSVTTTLSSRNGELSTQEWTSSQSASSESGDIDMMLSVTRLLETQRLMMGAQVQAMAAQSVPPLRQFNGEDIDSDEGSIDRWIEQFEERAKVMGWNDEQKLFQLKTNLEKTAEHAVRMLSEKEKMSYESVVAALQNRFHSLDIEELRGLEFHQLMQDQQSVEELGVQLQKLERKAFLGSGPREFDRMLKGHFYQALLPKWQRKLGAPKPTEFFEELYARARTLERHDQQFNASRNDSKQQRGKSKPLGKIERTNKAEELSHKDQPDRSMGKYALERKDATIVEISATSKGTAQSCNRSQVADLGNLMSLQDLEGCLHSQPL